LQDTKLQALCAQRYEKKGPPTCNVTLHMDTIQVMTVSLPSFLNAPPWLCSVHAAADLLSRLEQVSNGIFVDVITIGATGGRILQFISCNSADGTEIWGRWLTGECPR
jgi:hypothetical protein